MVKIRMDINGQYPGLGQKVSLKLTDPTVLDIPILKQLIGFLVQNQVSILKRNTV